MKIWPTKDPDEELTFGYDWLPDLEAGETLITGVFEGVDYPLVEQTVPAGTTIEAEQQDDSQLTLTISGGTDGMEAAFLIRVRTSLGNIFEDTVLLPIASTIQPVTYPGGMVPPTVANLIALYPELANVRGTVLAYHLQRAATYVDTSWSEADFGHARMVLAAHLLALGGHGSSVHASSVRDGSGEFRSMGIGSLRLERFDNRIGKGALDLTATPYGREYRSLLRRNKGGPRVTGLRTYGRGDGDRSQFPLYPWDL